MTHDGRQSGPKYGQLSYTSFDRAGVAGGWQVKETTGGVTAEEARVLVAGVTAMTPAAALPAYPTPDQIAALPRRLAYRHLDEHGGAYWHTAPAGADGTGRPGNVFAHVLLDRRPRWALSRPVQRWRAPEWLAPFGVHVADAALPARPPQPGTAVTAARVMEFVCDSSTWRIGTLCVLLDALAAALDTDTTVILGVDSPDRAALWIGAATFLMAPETAISVGFSTFDRIEDVARAPFRGHHLIAVPTADLDAAPTTECIVLDEHGTTSLGELGAQPHRTGRGHLIDVTAWSAMAQVMLIDPSAAMTTCDGIDDVSAQLAGLDPPPALPMALVALADERFADAHVEAAAVLSNWAPQGLPTAARELAGHTNRKHVHSGRN